MTQHLKHKIESIIGLSPYPDDKEIISRLKHLFYEAEAQEDVNVEAKSISALVAESVYLLDEDTSDNSIINTGFDSLDALLGGFRPGEFIVIGGRPSMGKTQHLVNLSTYISRTFPVLFVTFDLPVRLLTAKVLSSHWRTPPRSISSEFSI